MEPRERDLDLIEVILEDCSTLGKRLERFGVTEDSFVNDRSEDGELAYDAVMSPVYRIAEDALHFSDGLMSSFPDYPWKNIRGFRNFVAHGYREVDRVIAWKVVCEDIPRLATLLQGYDPDRLGSGGN